MIKKNKLTLVLGLIAFVVYSAILVYGTGIYQSNQYSDNGQLFISDSKTFANTNGTGALIGCTTSYKLDEDSEEIVLIEYIEKAEGECPKFTNEKIITSAELQEKLLNYEDRIVPHGEYYYSTLINNNLLAD